MSPCRQLPVPRTRSMLSALCATPPLPHKNKPGCCLALIQVRVPGVSPFQEGLLSGHFSTNLSLSG